MTPLKQTEEEFQQAVIQYARLMGWRVYHTRDSRRSEPGFPDLVCARLEIAAVVRAEVVVAELKSGAKVTTDQRWWLTALEASGVATYLWTPDDWPEINRVLARRRVTPAASRRSPALAEPRAESDGGSAGRGDGASAGDARAARHGGEQST